MAPPRRLHLAPRLALLLMVLLAACSSTPAPRALVMREVTFPLRDVRFPSGLRVIVEEDHRSPVVAVLTLVGAGSTSDPGGKEGLAHYVEHLAFRSKPDGKNTIWNLVERAGAGVWNAGTGLDKTVYWEMAPKEALPALLTLHGVRLLAPIANVTPEVAAVEREVVRNELRTRNETGIFGSILGYMQHAVFSPGSPYERPIGGTHESLSRVTLEDAQEFARKNYRPDNVTMVVIGDIDMQQIVRVVEESLPTALKAGDGHPQAPRVDRAPPEPPEPPNAMGMLHYEAALSSPELWIGWSLPRSLDAEGFLDRVASFAASGALSLAFRHDTDIAGVSVQLVGGTQASMLLCRVRLHRGANPERSQERVLDQLVRLWNWDPQYAEQVPGSSPILMRRATVSRERVIRAAEVVMAQIKRQAVTAMLFDAENIIARAQQRAELTHFTGDPQAYSRLLKAVTSLDAGRLSSFAHKYLTRERARSALITPTPGSATPPEEMEAAMPVPADEPPAVLDADAIRRYVHAPGVSGFRSVVLDNGMEVVIGRRAGLPLATVGLSLHGGVAVATPPGVARLARLARPKVTGSLSPADFGGHLGESFDLDDISYSFEGSSGNVSSMLAILAERAPAMRVDPDVAARFQRDILPSIRKTEKHPVAVAGREFLRALLGDHPYGRSVLADDIERAGASVTNDWIEAVTVPKNAVLAIVGEIEPAEVEQQVRDTFGRWSGSAPPQAPPPPPVLAAARAPRPSLVVAHRPAATQGQVRFGCLLPPAGSSKARYYMMAHLLEDRVTDVVRRRMGGSYGLHARATTLRGGAAYLTLAGDVDNAHLDEALSVLRRALILFEQGHFKDHEVDVARWRAARTYAVRYTTDDSLVGSILAARNEGRELRSIDAYPEDLVAVTPEALAEGFAKCELAPVLSIVGDEPTARAAFDKAWPPPAAASPAPASNPSDQPGSAP